MGTVDWWALLVVLVLICQACQAASAAPHGSAKAGSGVAFGAVPEQAWGYRRFHANDSLIGRPVPCTRYEKLCFQYNLLFDPVGKKCRALDLSNFGDRQVLFNGSGHLQAAQTSFDFCKYNGGVRAAFDNMCYKEELYPEVLCRCNSTLSAHILGGAECRCVPPEPLFVEQPREDGRCRIPDLRFPDIERKHLFEDLYGKLLAVRLSCSSQQLQCFSQRQVWLENGCYELRERGPCPKDHFVGLNAGAAANGSVEVTCVHVRGGCPEGHVLAAFDGCCHREDDLRVIVPGDVDLNPFGAYSSYHIGFITFPPSTRVENSQDFCVVNSYNVSPAPVARPPCGLNDKEKCTVEVLSEAPLPEL